VQDTPKTKQSSQPVTASEVYTSLYNDSDSVSTFRVPSFSADASSVQPSVKHTPRIVSEVPTLFTNTVPSDTVSRMSSLEKRFQNFHTGLEELKYQAQQEAKANIQTLNQILDMLRTAQGGIYSSIPSGQSALAGHQANYLAQRSPASGTMPGAAGSGS
jgi:hypothetical protein